MLHRFWFQFERRDDLPGGVRIGCGVTALSEAAAIGLMRERVFGGHALPAMGKCTVDVDVSSLDAGHVRLNMGNPAPCGSPLGTESSSLPSATRACAVVLPFCEKQLRRVPAVILVAAALTACGDDSDGAPFAPDASLDATTDAAPTDARPREPRYPLGDGFPIDERTESPPDASADSDAPLPVPPDAPILSPAPLSSDATADAAADAGPPPHPVSQYCGDGIRDPVKEECDDGTASPATASPATASPATASPATASPATASPATASPATACTLDCRVRAVVVRAGTEVEAAADPSPSWQNGPHVVAASGAIETGLAAVYADKGSVWVRTYHESGVLRGVPVDAAGDFAPLSVSNPVIAPLPTGKYAIAWSDGSTGTPDVRLRMFDGQAVGAAQLVHEDSSGLQQDPNLLWVGDRLIVAWTDLLDVKVRAFGADLAPLGPAKPLASSAAIESSVTLAPFGTTWVAAYRANDEGLESVRVAISGGITWSTEPTLPGPTGDRPAVVELDAQHLLVLFSVGADPAETGAAVTVGQLRAAVLSTGSPGKVTSFRLTPARVDDVSDAGAADTLDAGGDVDDDASGRPPAPPLYAMLDQRRPSAARVGDVVYVAWQNALPRELGVGDRLVVATATLDATSEHKVVFGSEMRLPYGLPPAGAQTNPRLGVSPLFPAGALATVWETRAAETDGGTAGALMLDFRPSPFVFLGEGDRGDR